MEKKLLNYDLIYGDWNGYCILFWGFRIYSFM